jgi:hypothetical protein
MDVSSTVSKVTTIEVDGMLWKPVPGATVSAEEFVEARALIREIHRLERPSPWAMDDRAQECNAAMGVFGRWTRAEPEFQRKTTEEHEADLERRLAEADAQAAEEMAQAENDRAERAARFDPERAQAPLALLEEQGVLTDQVRERDEIVRQELFPAMDETKLQEHLARLDAGIAAGHMLSRRLPRRWVIRRRPPMSGWLPAECGECALM